MIGNGRRSVNLKNLESRLLEQLQEALGSIVLWKVDCLLQEETLTVAVHAPESFALSPQTILPLIKTILAREESLSPYHLQTYLVVHGQRLEPTISAQLPVLASQNLLGDGKSQKFNNVLNKTAEWLEKSFSFEHSAKMFSLGVGISLVFGSFYLVTRPCVLGACPDLAQARQLAHNAVDLIDLSSSHQQVSTAQQTLTQSLDILQSIPPWSNYHTQAVTLLTTYQGQSEQLIQIRQSLETANRAVSLAHQAPLAAARWQEVQQLWQATLIPLAKIPSNSPFHSFAQVKLHQYQNNLATVGRHIQSEQKAIESLGLAKEAAKSAEIRQKTAQFLTDWQKVAAFWQSAIEYLKAISPETTAYSQAKPLLDTYLPQFIKAQTHREREQVALQHYNQALQKAKLAEGSAKKNQWSATVTYWQQGLNDLKQIPQNSFQYNQAQTLIAPYLLSLNQAQKNLKYALKQEQIHQNIDKICQKNDEICNYKITDDLIQINLTENYTKQVRQTGLQAQSQTNVKTQVDLLNHLAQLEKSLQIISNNTGRLVEVYNADRVLMAVYEPKR